MKQETKYYKRTEKPTTFVVTNTTPDKTEVFHAEPIDLPESIEKLKLEWQQHNRDNGLSWNEVAELVNQVAMLKPEKDYKERYQEIVNSEWFQKAHKEMSIGEVMGLPQITKDTVLKSFELYYHDEYGESIVNGAIDEYLKLNKIPRTEDSVLKILLEYIGSKYGELNKDSEDYKKLKFTAKAILKLIKGE